MANHIINKVNDNTHTYGHNHLLGLLPSLPFSLNTFLFCSVFFSPQPLSNLDVWFMLGTKPPSFKHMETKVLIFEDYM